MPIYEYGCAACGHEFEEWQKITDPPIKACPACGKRKVQKRVSMSSFHLKGGGWYADLYGSSSSSSKSNGKRASSGASADTPPKPAKSAAASTPASSSGKS
jgi:putative FmdB family regulatory protein